MTIRTLLGIAAIVLAIIAWVNSYAHWTIAVGVICLGAAEVLTAPLIERRVG